MIIDVILGAQEPAQIEADKIRDIFPYGEVSIEKTSGGLDVLKPDGSGKTIIVTAAIIVSFQMESLK